MRITCRESDLGRAIVSPDDAFSVFLPMMLRERETLCVMGLDSDRRVMLAQRVSIGTEDAVSCDMKLLFRPLIVADATFMLISHNHPNGDPTPSNADLRTTALIEVGAKVLGLAYVDHLVITHAGRYRSIAEYNERGF